MAIEVLQNGAHGQQPLVCIDMASADMLTHAAGIREACLSAGFFYIVNHGVDPNFLAEVFAQSKKFFALPLEEKMKLFRNQNQRGYTPFEADMLNPGYQSKGETKEGYFIGLSMESDLPLHGPNQYPSSDLLPGWRGTMNRYFQEMTGAMDLRIFVRESQAGPRATLHQVIGKGVDRYSIPFFFNPNYDCVVECLPTCCSEDSPLKYPPVRSGDHIVSLYKQTHKNAFLAIQ